MMIVPRLECAEVREGNAKLVKQLETIQMTAAEKVLRRCSSTTSNTVLRAELGMYPKTNIGARQLKWQYKVRNMPNKRLPAIADRAAWEKVTKERAGITWDSVDEKVWNDTGGNEEDILSIREVCGAQDKKNK